MPRRAYRVAVHLDIGKQKFAHQPHIGVGDECVFCLARDELRQLQRFPRMQQTVHRDHGDVGCRIGGRGREVRVNIAQIPQHLVRQIDRRLLEQPLDPDDNRPDRQQQRHFFGIRDPDIALQRGARGLAVPRDRFAHRLSGIGPEAGRVGDGLLVAAGKHERASLARVAGRLLRDHRLAEPVPHDRDVRARDAALLFFPDGLSDDNVLERKTEEAQGRWRAFDMSGRTQRRAQRVEDRLVRQHDATRQTIDLHRSGKPHGSLCRQTAEQVLQHRGLLKRQHGTVPGRPSNPDFDPPY